MNWDRIQDSWKQLRGNVTGQWGKLTDDDVDAIDGSRVFLAGKIQERYGVARDEAEKQVRKWQRQINDNWL
ncbi:MAG TPA: CsbD family protein [Rhodocyclaceae bacterium]|nr:CsbD family protein [Rhodocyclaceae bacterium]